MGSLVPITLEDKIEFDKVVLFDSNSETREFFKVIFGEERVRSFYYNFRLYNFLVNSNNLLDNSLVVVNMDLRYDLDNSAKDVPDLESLNSWVEGLHVNFPCSFGQDQPSYCCSTPSSKLACGIYKSLALRGFPVESHFIFTTSDVDENIFMLLKKTKGKVLVKDLDFYLTFKKLNNGLVPTNFKQYQEAA